MNRYATRLPLYTLALTLAALGVGCSDSDSAPNALPDNSGEPESPVMPGDGNEPGTPASVKTVYLDEESVSVPTGGLFLVTEFIGDLNGDGKGDLLADTSTIILGSESSAQDSFASNERMSTAAELFTATVLDFNGNGQADILLPNYDGNLPQSRFGGFDLVLDQTDLSLPIVFDGSNGARINGVEPGQEHLSFTPVGDINGDGLDDLVGFLDGSLTQAGAATVILYGASGLPASENDVTVFSGNSVDRLIPEVGVRFESGRLAFVVPLGDINQDGFDDFALRYSREEGGVADGERAYDMLIVYGNSGGIDSVASFNASTATSIGTRLDGSLIQDTAGDFNADGIPDLVIATQTTEGSRIIYSEGVLLGEDWQAQSSFSATELAERTITFSGYSADFGSLQLHPAGDFNGDGFEDLLVEDAGRMLLIPAGAVGNAMAVDLADLPVGSLELKANADESVVHTYQYEDSQSDINGDGFDDLLLYSQSAGVRVLFGRAEF